MNKFDIILIISSSLPGKPGRPECSEVTGYTLNLAWAAPESDGGAEITDYHIEYREQGATKWTHYPKTETSPDLHHLIKNLTEDAVYEFRVAAENKAGTGPWSDPSEPVRTLTGSYDYFFLNYISFFS